MAISQAVIEAVRERTDIVTVVGRYTRLTRKGDRFWGCCPFHAEKTPSFTVTPALKSYYCFGCRAGGDIFKFVSELEKVSFTESVKILAQQAGIAVDDEESNENISREKQKKEALTELYQKVCRVYEYLLWESAEGEKSLRYLTARGLNEETIKKFKIGYTHSSGTWLYAFLKKRGYSEEFLAESGLFSRKNAQYSLFRNRVAFPVFNAEGQCVAFSCRVLPPAPPEAPKYINSPETLIYKKKFLLYGLSNAKASLREKKQFILCEGTMDVCALHQMGYQEAVAPLGSAFTEGQAKLLKRYAAKGFLMFDADAAGQKAIRESAALCEREELETFAVKLEGGKDPAEILQKGEEYLLTKAFDSARVSFDFILLDACSKEKKGDAAGVERIGKALFPYILSVQSPIKKEAYIKILAEHLALPVDAVRAELKRFGQYRSGPALPDTAPDKVKPAAAVKHPVNGGALYELMTAFLIRPDLYSRKKADVKAAYITDERLVPVMEYLNDEGEKADIFTFIERGPLDEPLKKFFLKNLLPGSVVSWEERAERALQRLEIERLERQEAEIVELLARTEQNNWKAESMAELIEDKTAIAKQIDELKKRL
jgi:DNA primase